MLCIDSVMDPNMNVTDPQGAVGPSLRVAGLKDALNSFVKSDKDIYRVISLSF